MPWYAACRIPRAHQALEPMRFCCSAWRGFSCCWSQPARRWPRRLRRRSGRSASSSSCGRASSTASPPAPSRPSLLPVEIDALREQAADVRAAAAAAASLARNDLADTRKLLAPLEAKPASRRRARIGCGEGRTRAADRAGGGQRKPGQAMRGGDRPRRPAHRTPDQAARRGHAAHAAAPRRLAPVARRLEQARAELGDFAADAVVGNRRVAGRAACSSMAATLPALAGWAIVTVAAVGRRPLPAPPLRPRRARPSPASATAPSPPPSTASAWCWCRSSRSG